MNLINGVIIITNILGSFSIFKLITAFYERKNTNKCIELLSYALYYILNCIISIVCPIPMIILLFCAISILIITFNYKSTMQKRIIVTFYICLIIVVVELGFMAIFEYKKIFVLKMQEFHSIYPIISVEAIIYIISLLIAEQKSNMRKIKDVAVLYWLGVISIPLTTLIIMILFLNIATGREQVQILVVLFSLTIINIVSFQLYSYIVSAILEENKKIVLLKQGEVYRKQLRMIQDDNLKMSLIRHDIKNHLFMLKTLHENGEKDSYNKYFNDLLTRVRETEKLCNSGNLIFDSIINYRLRDMEEIDICIDACMPNKINVSDVDMTIILGNLLDNAVRALEDVKGEKILTIEANYSKGRLILQIENTYKYIKEENGNLKTTKEDSCINGLGLESVKETVERHDGVVQVEYNSNIFTVIVILFC